MFPQLQTEIENRFQQITDHYAASPKSPADVAQTCRGLVFVEAYAVYEYTVRTATRHAITQIASHPLHFNEIKASLMALYLDAELKGLRDCSEKRVWEKRLSLFRKSVSNDRIVAVVAQPHDGNYFRHTQLQMTFDVLGITRKITAKPRHHLKIDEVVDNRNSIAHGEETPAEVGRRYANADIRSYIRVMRGVCTRIVAIMSEHCSDPAGFTRYS